MEPANKGLAQLSGMYRSMTPAARVTAAALLVVTTLGVAYLFNARVGDADAYLMDGESFSPAELRDMQAAFGKAGLEAEIEGARIKIPRRQESKYMAALADAGALPADFGHHMEQAVNAGGLLRVPYSQQQAVWRVAMQRDLQRAIGEMRGIDRAFVQLDEEQIDAFPHPKKSTTAAVMVFPEGDGPLATDTVRAIQKIMVSSVSGLGAERVMVVDMSTNDTYCAADGAPGDSFVHQKKRQELEWKQRIGEVLRYIPGVLVNTNVELPPEVDGAQDQGRITPKRVRASVVVPHTYHLEVWRKEHRSASNRDGASPEAAELAAIEAREKQKIERLVGNLLPRDEEAMAGGQAVVVSTFYPIEEPKPASAAEELRGRAATWAIANWRTLCLGGAALFGLAVFGTLVRSAGRAPKRPAGGIKEIAETRSSPGEGLEAFHRGAPVEPRAPPATAGSSLTCELADAVRDDPHAALSVLRTWVGNTG